MKRSWQREVERRQCSVSTLISCWPIWANRLTVQRQQLGQVQLIIALAALVGILVFVGSSVPYWNRVLAYARGEQKT
jgi:hypothetical protein